MGNALLPVRLRAIRIQRDAIIRRTSPGHGDSLAEIGLGAHARVDHQPYRERCDWRARITQDLTRMCLVKRWARSRQF
ncbi:MAG: hypothetical protein GDA65_18315 [Nitrospira sp. CR1.1]|nr:hypothetical protein [Nitrospira sp. CR1.1]